MQKRTQVMITFAVLILLVMGLYYFTDWFSKVTGYLFGESDTSRTIKCLQNKNAEFYWSEYCADCERQKDLFGQEIFLITSINCGKDGELCPNIRETPAWFIGNEVYYGFRNLSELKILSQCG